MCVQSGAVQVQKGQAGEGVDILLKSGLNPSNQCTGAVHSLSSPQRRTQLNLVRRKAGYITAKAPPAHVPPLSFAQ